MEDLAVRPISLDSINHLYTRFQEISPTTKLAIAALTASAAAFCAWIIWNHYVGQEDVDEPTPNSFFDRLINAVGGKELWDRRLTQYNDSWMIHIQQVNWVYRVCVRNRPPAGNTFSGKWHNVPFVCYRYSEKNTNAPVASKIVCFFPVSGANIHRMDHWRVCYDCEAPCQDNADQLEPVQAIHRGNHYKARECKASDIEWLEQLYANTNPTHTTG